MKSPSQSRNSLALVAVCLSALMLGLEITSIPSILPTLEQVLPADFRQLQWIMNAYTIAMCAVLMAMGTFGDRYGRKRIFMAGIVVFGVSSLICGLATSAPLLIAARFIQGISAAAMLACQVAVLSHQFRNGSERSKAFSWWGIIFGIGLGFGPIIGGAISVLASWEWVFLIHSVLAVATFVFAQKGVEESFDPYAAHIDFAGIITLSLGVFGIVYLITQGKELSLARPQEPLILILSAISLFMFVVIEKRADHPMFDFSVFRVRKFSGALLGSSGMNFSFWPFVVYLPLYLQSVLGYGVVASGLTVLAYTVPTIVVPPLAERLLQRRGPGFVIPLGLFTIGLGFILIHSVVGTTVVSWLTLLPGCLIAGIGLGLTNTPVTNTATAALPPERAGMASGMDMSARMISLAVNIALMGFILMSGVSSYLTHAGPQLNDDNAMRIVADTISAGNFSIAKSYGYTITLAREALSNGTSWVTLYGAICAWFFSLFSFIVFRSKKPAMTAAQLPKTPI